jgi:CheY-like chemotaxis protein
MDIQMPVMDGIEATRRILAQTTTEKRPYLIAVTAHALEGDREYYLSLGMNNYLSKTVKLNQLVEALYQSLSPQTQPSAPPQPSPIATISAHPIDLAELASLVGSDTTEFLEMMAPIFLEDTPKLLHTLADAIQNNDSTGMVHAAHTLKGTSASLAMKTLAERSRELEQMAKAADFSAVPRLFQEIQAEYGRIEAALANLVETAV